MSDIKEVELLEDVRSSRLAKSEISKVIILKNLIKCRDQNLLWAYYKIVALWSCRIMMTCK